MLARLGLQRTTLVDVPGRVAATVFTHGCPLRCPYCHNAGLQGGPIPDDFLPREQVLEHLRQRSNVLEAVCVTGGEPLLHADLPEFLGELRGLGYHIKLDTSGIFPDRLEEMLSAGLVDMVALDLKTSWNRYSDIGGDGQLVQRSLKILRRFRESGGPEYELRTTLAPNVVSTAVLQSLAGELLPDEDWVLAQFRPPDPDINPLPQPEPFSRSQLQEIQALLVPNHPSLRLRGVSPGS